MIIGELTTGVRILLEKRPSRYNISEDLKFPENIQKFLFCQKTGEARRRAGGGPQGGHTTPRRGPALGRAWAWCGHPSPLLPMPLRVFHPPENPKPRGATREIFCRRCEAENTRERESSPTERNLPGKFPPGGGNHRHRHRHRHPAGLHWDHHHHQIGRASCRERVCQYV